MATTTTTPTRANPLRAALAKAGGTPTMKPAPHPEPEIIASVPEPFPAVAKSNPSTTQNYNEDAEDAPNELSIIVESIEVEAVVGGCLQRIRLKANTDPAQVKAIILAADPGALVRDAFPVRGGGSRETKTARALVINVRVSDSGKFVDIICQNGEDLSVAVSKKRADGFPTDLANLNRLTEHSLAKIVNAYQSKGLAVVILTEPEQFGVNYWVTDDGKAFLDSLSAEPPAAQPTAQA